MHPCPFCTTDLDVVAESEAFVAIRDAYPVNPGHTLILSRRHARHLFELTEKEFTELYAMLHTVRSQLQAEYSTEQFNVGANIGRESGQTIDHFHLHVIPRFEGDVEEPRGGVRNIKPPIVPY